MRPELVKKYTSPCASKICRAPFILEGRWSTEVYFTRWSILQLSVLIENFRCHFIRHNQRDLNHGAWEPISAKFEKILVDGFWWPTKPNWSREGRRRAEKGGSTLHALQRPAILEVYFMKYTSFWRAGEVYFFTNSAQDDCLSPHSITS